VNGKARRSKVGLCDRRPDHGGRGVVELVFGIKADRPSLEAVTKPLTAVPDERSEEDVSDE
jgi:hypothetical protein